MMMFIFSLGDVVIVFDLVLVKEVFIVFIDVLFGGEGVGLVVVIYGLGLMFV